MIATRVPLPTLLQTSQRGKEKHEGIEEERRNHLCGTVIIKIEQVTLLANGLQIAMEQRKSPETVEISGLFGCGERT